jgi:hypothetical protein
VGPRAGLDDVEMRKFLTLQGLELRPLGRPAHIQSLYRLSYSGSLSRIKTSHKVKTHRGPTEGTAYETDIVKTIKTDHA